MTTQEVQEGNEIVAVYDGWQWESEEWDMMYKISDGFWYSENELHEDASLDEAVYHSDWNWLIPVVKKVQQEMWQLGKHVSNEWQTDNQVKAQDSSIQIANAIQELDIEP